MTSYVIRSQDGLKAADLSHVSQTKHLQEALATCGWREAAELQQHDASEAFTFITGKLELPLLTLKMDLYHTGREDPNDDHKFINERLLEVAILPEPLEGSTVITLEDCLEHYFNNRIEVKRHLQNQRRNTLKSVSPLDLVEKEPGTHVETVEIGDRPDTPVVESPVELKTPAEKLRPTAGRKRADSIFSQRKVEMTGLDPEKTGLHEANDSTDAKGRKMSTRTEVLMPAWQFFKLLPWYTDNVPTSDAQVAAHFSKKRPVLGICLKRYQVSNTGRASRLNTYVDIPLEIAVPNFVTDDSMQDDGPLSGNFRLLLQSVVCHRGASVDSGHYVSLVRGRAANAQGRGPGEDSDDDDQDPWMRFDDLARERVSYVDIHEALKRESPYLLFYQVQPMNEDGLSVHDLPSYAEATSRSQSDANPSEKPFFHQPDYESETVLVESNSESQLNGGKAIESTDWAQASSRNSLDANAILDERRGRSSMSSDHRRKSIAFDESSFAGSAAGSVKTDQTGGSIPTTPLDERSGGFLSVASKLGSRRGSRVSRSSARSRPNSTGPPDVGSRFSLNMSKLTQRMSRSDMQGVQPSAAVAAELANEKDAEKTITPAALQPTAAGRESVDTAKPLHDSHKGKTRKERKEHDKRKKAHKGQEDRDCVLM